MKALALYGSARRSKDAQRIEVAGAPYYVRTEIITQRGRSSKHYLARALDLAHPRRGETVLNTVPVPKRERRRVAKKRRG